jgi:hypothetical protein
MLVSAQNLIPQTKTQKLVFNRLRMKNIFLP